MGIFRDVARRKVRKSKFDLSHSRKMSIKQGFLIPILLKDVVPGDDFRMNTELLMRWAPMLAPIMHRVNVFMHGFYVPDRLVWNESESYYTGGKTGTEEPVKPYLTINTTNVAAGRFELGTLADAFGLPHIAAAQAVNAAGQINVSALPFRAYQLVYNEYYRDQNLTDPVDFAFSSGDANADAAVLMQIRKKAWEKDYFTSALPFTQRGGDVLMPFSAEVEYKPVSDVVREFGVSASGPLQADAGNGELLDDFDLPSRIENIEEISNGETTIRDLRRAARLQEFFEKMATGGARYWEYLQSIFGVKTRDSRLQRPEFLAGAVTPAVVSEVLSTVLEVTTDVPQGNMAGHGIAVGNRFGFRHYFPEHGHVMVLMAVVPKTAYQQGIDRMWTRANRFEELIPDFAHIGEQEVKNQELFYDPTATGSNNPLTFGYQSRYAEFKYAMDTVHGEMKTNLAFWHQGRIFEDLPALNADFVTSDPTKRIFAVEDEDVDDLYVMIHHNLSALRPLPYFGSPRL